MRHYTIKSILRQLPNLLLERYFNSKGGFAEEAEEETGRPLFDAWGRLTGSERSQLDVELRTIFDQSCVKGVRRFWVSPHLHGLIHYCTTSRSGKTFKGISKNTPFSISN
jgi:hypothetical protein